MSCRTQPRVIPAVKEQPTLKITDAGAILELNRDQAYRAARNGHLPTLRVSTRRSVVPTATLRAMLGLPIDGPAIDLSDLPSGDAA